METKEVNQSELRLEIGKVNERVLESRNQLDSKIGEVSKEVLQSQNKLVFKIVGLILALGDKSGLAQSYDNQAVILKARGEIDEARIKITEAIEITKTYQLISLEKQLLPIRDYIFKYIMFAYH